MSAQDSIRDVIALVTAALAGDDDLVYQLVEDCDDPRAVLAGMAGFAQETLLQLAEATGQSREDLATEWREAAVGANLRMAQGRAL